MLHHSITAHYSSVAALAADPQLKNLVRRQLGLPSTTALLPAMAAQGLCQAELVLCLLRLRDAHAALRRPVEDHIAALVGHPIQVGTPCLLGLRASSRPLCQRADPTPRLLWVAPENPRKPGTKAWLRWREYRVGRSVAQLKCRGIGAKDIRLCKTCGWIRLEEVR
jgi:hypothetical protein